MRATILVIDSFGIGEAPDAAAYGDTGANTALHICERIAGEKWPTLAALGLGNASLLLGNELPGCGAVERPAASYGVMVERSPGKDTTTGHWELAGIQLVKPFHTFPSGPPSFPPELIAAFEREIGRGVLGDKAASGTVIIEELGSEHLRTGLPIVYTSSDSVFQIAAHEEVIALSELYRMCEIARRLCDPYQVGRVIARPFIGRPGAFTRSSGRRDFSIALPEKSLLDHLAGAGVQTIGVGKIGDIFNEQGIVESHHDKGNPACLERTIELLRKPSAARGELIFVNLVDTDMVYGHRRDVQGYFDAVSGVDAGIRRMLPLLPNGDLLLVTADHGCDPTFKGSDHTREHVPILAYRAGRPGRSLGVRQGYFDAARTLADLFQVGGLQKGSSFAALL